MDVKVLGPYVTDHA